MMRMTCSSIGTKTEAAFKQVGITSSTFLPRPGKRFSQSARTRFNRFLPMFWQGLPGFSLPWLRSGCWARAVFCFPGWRTRSGFT
jgi:hypothetical protein